jgi:hypothetical protein
MTMPDGTDDTTKTVAGSGDGTKDVAWWQNEAKTAFAKRDELKKQMAKFDGIDPDRYRDLQAKADEAEQARLQATGQFEAAKKNLETKYQGEIKTRDERLTALERQVADEKIGAAFSAALDLFGPGGETILPPDVAARYFDGVHYEDVEIAGKTIRTVVVRDATGNIVLGADGNPAPFADALRTVIKALPASKQDRLLRGSGKVGSGSSGSAGIPIPDADLEALVKRVQSGDKDAINALRARQAHRGGMVVGSAWDK